MEEEKTTYELIMEEYKNLEKQFFNDPEKFIIEQTLFTWARVIHSDIDAESLILTLELLNFLKVLKEETAQKQRTLY